MLYDINRIVFCNLAVKHLFLLLMPLRCGHRGFYMSAHVLLILLNELGKRDKMRGLPSILSFFRNEFNKFNVRFYLSYDIKISVKSHFCPKNVIILSLFTQRCYGRHNVSRKSVNH